MSAAVALMPEASHPSPAPAELPEVLYAWVSPEGLVHQYDFATDRPGKPIGRWTKTGTRTSSFAVVTLASRKWIAPLEWDIGSGCMLCFKRDRVVFHR